MHQPTTFEVDGDAIREERMQAGLTQDELAQRAGISRRYVSHLENGTRRHMGLKTYPRLRSALNTTDTRIRRTPPTEDPPRPTERT
ncbi:XRE family transcriptional regulator [Streptomyces lavendulae]|nr:helix-turn-helix transcriptional regulator [Streptomyces lavendulae]TXJ78566.1 XRE family transcriptional regulator [Streptomyces lavendulae]